MLVCPIQFEPLKKGGLWVEMDNSQTGDSMLWLNQLNESRKLHFKKRQNNYGTGNIVSLSK